MEALFQIGKELGALEARVRSLEAADCGCKSKGAKKPGAEPPEEQRAILAQVTAKHGQIVKGFNEVLKELGLGTLVKINGFHLVGVDVRQDDEDQCCMCCQLDEQSGWQYCCDYQGCATCC